jgi:hypothetical protein
MSRLPDATEIAERLADRAEAVCRKYLSKGFKSGNYWMVGDVTGAPGQSLHVRLRGPLSGRGAAGKWTDEATGQFGNLLDVIKHVGGYSDAEFPKVLAEARQFLAMPDPVPSAPGKRVRRGDSPVAGREFASRLFTSSQGIEDTIAETYLLGRGIVLQPDFTALRFHPRCFHDRVGGRAVYWPGLIAAVTDLDLDLAGVSRTYLARDGFGKAPVDPQRRSKGDILGNGIRFGRAGDILAAGEGLETTLSLRRTMPALPVIAATGSNHLAALAFPETLRTLLVIRDNDHGGDSATDALFARGRASGIDVVLIEPETNDLNADLMLLGAERMCATVRRQLPQNVLERYFVSGSA